MGKLFTKQEMKNKLLISHPFSKIEVLENGNINEPLIIKCLECGAILTFKKAPLAKSAINLCKEKHFSNGFEKRDFLAKTNSFEMIEQKNRKIVLKCKNCGDISIRGYSSFLAYPNHCKKCRTSGDKQCLSFEKAQEKIDNIFKIDEYSLLKYQSYHEKALVRHNSCGFIWSQGYAEILSGKGCPKCNKIRSKGEIAINEYLKENAIPFVSQKSLKKPLQRYKFDFFLPEINLAIEYQGEQHYKEKSHWEGLEKIQERDKIKKAFCDKENIELLEISYLDYKKIPEILTSRLNDYSQEVALKKAKQTTPNGEDIVCSLPKDKD